MQAGCAGDQAKSGSAGFALINNTVISTGLVGTYNLSFTAESVSTHAIVTMQSNGTINRHVTPQIPSLERHRMVGLTPLLWLFIAVLAVQLIGQAVPSSIAAGEIVEFTVQVTLPSPAKAGWRWSWTRLNTRTYATGHCGGWYACRGPAPCDALC